MVAGNATDLAAVLAALNETGGIPISVNMIAEQNAGQFWITVGVSLFGMLFLLIYLCGVEGAEREGSLRKGGGESGAPSSLSPHTGILYAGESPR